MDYNKIIKSIKIKVRLNSKILSNHPVDKSNKIPRKNLNFIIHSPGLGITLITHGNKIHTKYGIAKPTEIEKKILNRFQTDKCIHRWMVFRNRSWI